MWKWCMKIYNGYPDEVVIDGVETTVHDVNRMLLSLMWDKRLSDGDKGYLLCQYRTERQRYLDAQYEMTEENRKLLAMQEQKLSDEIENCEVRLERLKQRELEKKAQGLRSAKRIAYHLEIDNRALEEGEPYNTEEVELWDYLFSENCTLWAWGVSYNSVEVREEEDSRPDWRKNLTRKVQPGKKEESSFKTLGCLKKKYGVAWQDVQKIQHFRLTIQMEY